MGYRRLVLAFIVLAVWCAPLHAQEDDRAGVKAIFDNDIRLFNAQNKDAFSIAAHDDIVLFGILSPFAIKGKEALAQVVRNYFEDNTRIIFKPVNPTFTIMGNSALAWGSYSITEYPKVGPRVTIHGRYTFTYAKIEGKWFLAAMHLSPLQGY